MSQITYKIDELFIIFVHKNSWKMDANQINAGQKFVSYLCNCFVSALCFIYSLKKKQTVEVGTCNYTSICVIVCGGGLLTSQAFAITARWITIDVDCNTTIDASPRIGLINI